MCVSFQVIHSLKYDAGEPERFKSSREVKTLLSDLNRRLGLPPHAHLSYGKLLDPVNIRYNCGSSHGGERIMHSQQKLKVCYFAIELNAEQALAVNLLTGISEN